jgi:hypothetical protein
LIGVKRPRPPAPGDDEEKGPWFSLATVLPLSVWREHLGPWLSAKEAARLSMACKAFEESMREWPVNLGRVKARDLEAALTCFPAAQSLQLVLKQEISDADEWSALEVLRERGRTLTHVDAEGKPAGDLLASAVGLNALPNLTHFSFNFHVHGRHLYTLLGGALVFP